MVAGCEASLRGKRYNCCRDFILLNLGRILESIKSIDTYTHKYIPVYKWPTMITGENQRWDLILISNNNLHLLEITAGYQTNIDLSSNRKEESYTALMDRLAQLYYKVQFINLSVGALGLYDKTPTSLIRF